MRTRIQWGPENMPVVRKAYVPCRRQNEESAGGDLGMEKKAHYFSQGNKRQ